MNTSKIDAAETTARRLLLADSTLSIREAAQRAGIAKTTLRDRLEKKPIQGRSNEQEYAAGLEEFADGSATLTSDAGADLWTPEELLRAHGMDPDDWEVVSVRTSRWGDPESPSEQLRVNAIRADSLLREAEMANWTPPPAPTAPDFGDRSLVICGDHHAPHHDKGLHDAFLSYLADERPDQGIILGDLADYSDISRHRSTKGFAQSVNTCNDAVVGILMDYREASPETRWTVLRGNHDDRLEYALLDYKPELYGVRPGIMESGDEVSSLSLRRLWHLDDLSINLVDEEWNRAKFAITDSFTARHGYMVSEGTGKQMLTKHSNSQAQGHSHRMRFTYRTKHDPIDTKVAIECGTMAEIRDGLGYADEPDWQQGFVTGYAWDDGDFAVAPAVYIRDRILLPDGRRFYAN